MTAGMFDPLPKGSPKVTQLRMPEWRVILPAPEGVPAPPDTHPSLGTPVKRWEL